MIRTILVPARAHEADTAIFAAALRVARAFDAHIDALHVRIDPVKVAISMTTDGVSGAGMITGRLIDDLDEAAQRAELKARHLFTEFCEHERLAITKKGLQAIARPSAHFAVETGEEPRWMASYGMTADLVVAPRGEPGYEVGRSTLETALMESGRPLLIPPTSAAEFGMPETAVIAWKPSAQAAKAVAAAMPFIERTRDVVVMTVREGAEQHADDERVLRYLNWHGITATIERLSAGEEGGAKRLLTAATARPAPLLIMGGYGHSRLREWVFGGFTRHVLAQAPIPVLLAH